MDVLVEVVETKRTLVLVGKQGDESDTEKIGLKAINHVINGLHFNQCKVVDTYFSVQSFEHPLVTSAPLDSH